MFVYAFNIFLIIVEGLWLLYQYPSDKNKKRFCCLASVQWILISGLRHISIGADTEQYMKNFERVKTYTWDYVLDFARTQVLIESDSKAPGYTLVEKIFQIFFKDYRAFLLFVAILFFSFLGYSLYKNSDNAALSYILFSCLFYSFFAITGIRQTIATALVVFLGIEFIKKRKLIPFIVIIIVMMTIHTSSICFLPFYWIAKVKINKKTLIIYWILILASFSFRYRFMNLLQYLVGYENYQQNEGASASTFLYLLILVAIYITIFHSKIKNKERYLNKCDFLEKQEINGMIVDKLDDNEIPMLQISMNALFVACIFSSLLLINQNTMRVVQYYSLFLMYLLPDCSHIFAKRRDVWIFNFILVVLLILLFLKGSHPYMFFWQS